MRRILVISASIIEYDGRLRELVEVAKLIGETFCVSQSVCGSALGKNHFLFKGRGPFWYLSFIFHAVKTAWKLGGIDILIADNRKAILPSVIINLLGKGKILVQDARELCLLHETRHLSGKIGCLVEMCMNRSFSITISANQERAEVMRRYYRLKAQPLVFENVRRLEGPSSQSERGAEDAGLCIEGKWVIVSTSGCSVDRGTDRLVDAVGKMGSDYTLYLVGWSSDKDFQIIDSIIKRNGYMNVHLIGPMRAGDLKAFLGRCHVGVVNYHQKDMNNKYCASGKVYEFLFEGLPIITTENPPLKSLCERKGVGVASDDFERSIREVVADYQGYKDRVQAYANSIDIGVNRERLKAELIDALGRARRLTRS